MRLVCLTEESVEFFYRLGRPEVVVGVSVYAVRPKELPDASKLMRVSAFTHANIKKIIDLKPDLVIGFSDVQKEIAKDLTDRGIAVLITHQRSIEEIFKTLEMFGNLIGEKNGTLKLLESVKVEMEEIKLSLGSLKKQPKIYFEEWDEPRVSGSLWIQELLSYLGAQSLNMAKAKASHKALERTVTDGEVISFNPDLIFFSWCGKKGLVQEILSREGYGNTKACQSGNVFEIPAEIILQPGLASLIDGLKIFKEHISEWNSRL